jgi:hypothetical protein
MQPKRREKRNAASIHHWSISLGFWLIYPGTLGVDSFGAERPSPMSAVFKPAVSASSDAQFLDGGRAGSTPADCE